MEWGFCGDPVGTMWKHSKAAVGLQRGCREDVVGINWGCKGEATEIQ